MPRAAETKPSRELNLYLAETARRRPEWTPARNVTFAPAVQIPDESVPDDDQ
jgi:hypothetical protein